MKIQAESLINVSLIRKKKCTGPFAHGKEVHVYELNASSPYGFSPLCADLIFLSAVKAVTDPPSQCDGAHEVLILIQCVAHDKNSYVQRKGYRLPATCINAPLRPCPTLISFPFLDEPDALKRQDRILKQKKRKLKRLNRKLENITI